MATSPNIPSKRQIFLNAVVCLLVATSTACGLARNPSIPTNPVASPPVASPPVVQLLMTEEVPPQATEPEIAEADTWVSIGPWVNINVLAIDPLTPSIIYAGTDGGMFKSTSSGESWSAISSGLNDVYIEDVVIDPLTPTTIYVATGVTTVDGGGVFKSIDGGNNWNAVNDEFTQYAFRLVINPLSPTTLYVVTRFDGVFKSTNGGESWSAINTGLTEGSQPIVLAIDPVTPSTLYVGTSRGGVFKSTDSGEHWSAVNNGIDLNTTDMNSVDEVVIDPVTPTTVYAVSWFKDIYKSTNGGQNWIALDVGLKTTFDIYSRLTIDPTTPSTIYIITDELYRSTNGGESWQMCNTIGLKKVFISFLAMDPVDSSILYIGTHGGGIYTNRTYEGFVPVQMPSLTPLPPAATEDPSVAVPAPTEAPVVVVPSPTLSVRSTLAPLEFPFTASGWLNNRNDIQLPENARLLVLWYVIAEEPQYIYVFGKGNIDIANNSFELVLDEPPPSEALNWMGSASLGVGHMFITTNQTVQTGKMHPEVFAEAELLGASGQYSIIYVNNGFEIGEYIPWYNEFIPGYSAGKGLDGPDSGFDEFEPVDPTTIEIIIDNMENIHFVDWF